MAKDESTESAVGQDVVTPALDDQPGGLKEANAGDMAPLDFEISKTNERPAFKLKVNLTSTFFTSLRLLCLSVAINQVSLHSTASLIRNTNNAL